MLRKIGLLALLIAIPMSTLVWNGQLGVAPVAARSDLNWQPCAEIAEDWDQADRVSECARIKVPVDHAKPDGRKIELAISRIKATDIGRRKGALLLNPGGPGDQATTMPAQFAKSKLGELGKVYDLVGFDIRGSGYSDKFHCAEMDVTSSAQLAPALAACAKKDPESMRAFNTETNARDMDLVRQALGEDEISFYGVSWGTSLGSVYRTLFDSHVDRMMLDSVLAPGQAMDQQRDQATAREELTRLFMAWIARHDAVYHFGGTVDAVTTAVDGLKAKTDESTFRSLLGSARADWAESAGQLAGLRDGTAPKAPPARPANSGNGLWKLDYQDGDANLMLYAFRCNEAAGLDFCAQYPFPAKHFDLVRGTSRLQLVGHRWETNTVYGWAQQMRESVGDALLTVNDDVHASFWNLPCASKGVQFFLKGSLSNDVCEGAPIREP
ncbi:alpha/beta fold hydrolase [Pseudonocardiaceae bacterium YIM PH 21723]|nr:alpha/beta fold hydrolase [Pseudonocardiaceae bacterium YIM PH 21723]